MKKELRVMIACGGTGGHLFPGIAVAKELQARGHRALLVVSPKPVDAEALRHNPEFESRTLATMGWPGFKGTLVLKFVVRLVWAWCQGARLMGEWKPDAVLGMGGFTSAVPLDHGRRRGLPTFLHESNAIPGRVTRRWAKEVSAVLLGFAEANERLPQGSTSYVTGTPVRQTLWRSVRADAFSRLGLDPARRTLLVMGGSQGARPVNEAVMRGLEIFGGYRDQWQFLHMSGQGEGAAVQAGYNRARMSARVLEFCGDMGDAYAVADLAVSRAGASSITELLACHLPSILIPYPLAADDHQSANARAAVATGAAVAMEQERAMSGLLGKRVEELLGNTERLAEMRAAARVAGEGHRDAASRVAERIEEAWKL
jgi:UDP-N-acetylglucosamine--N-acetylmuramyl-(pentapeptide) pyrophosphoryl-undecaprenol N-acetylglucosamine transferase